jgi:acyl CoA:acetate/3-ketoacid CoA transferase
VPGDKTERAVFELSGEGLVLTEIAPGVDLQKDIPNKTEFSPMIGEALKPMGAHLFRHRKRDCNSVFFRFPINLTKRLTLILFRGL